MMVRQVSIKDEIEAIRLDHRYLEHVYTGRRFLELLLTNGKEERWMGRVQPVHRRDARDEDFHYTPWTTFDGPWPLSEASGWRRTTCSLDGLRTLIQLNPGQSYTFLREFT